MNRRDWMGIGPGSAASGPDSFAMCQSGGSATLSAPPQLALDATIYVEAAKSCLDDAGRCSEVPFFSMQSSDGQLKLQVTFPETASGTTFTLPSPDVSAQAVLLVSPTSEQPVVSGTLTIQSVGPSGFQASFDLQMKTAGGQVITITAGQASASACSVESAQAMCAPIFS